MLTFPPLLIVDSIPLRKQPADSGRNGDLSDLPSGLQAFVTILGVLDRGPWLRLRGLGELLVGHFSPVHDFLLLYWFDSTLISRALCASAGVIRPHESASSTSGYVSNSFQDFYTSRIPSMPL